MKICVIETGLARDSLKQTFGTYPEMIESLLSPYMGDSSFSTTSLVQGDNLPATKDFDGYIIMGSRHSVYDDLPWIGPLRQFIRTLTSERIPLVGICFGHQIMAEALGGKVAAAEEGWLFGVQEYLITETGRRIKSVAYHHDQIVENPPNIDILMKNESCVNAACVYQNFPAFSVQPHPEFEKHFTSGLLKISRDGSVPETIVDQALNTIDTPIHQQRFARAISELLLNKADTAALSKYLSEED
jgi:GMP synthase-like glutamine amidotransferase